MKFEKRILMGLGAIVAVATLAAPAVTADGNKPTKAAIDKMKESHVTPSPDSGVVDPAKDAGVALILRDPETGSGPA